MSEYKVSKKNTILVNTTNELFLTEKDSGSLIFVDPSSSVNNITLPPPELGLNYKIIAKSTHNSNAVIIKSVNSSLVLTALMKCIGFGTNNRSMYKQISFTGNSTPDFIGETIDFNCDGTTWFLSFISVNSDNYTFTT